MSEKEAWKFAALNSLDLVVVLPGFVVGPCLPDQLSKTAGDVLNLLKGKVAPHLTHVDSMEKINKSSRPCVLILSRNKWCCQGPFIIAPYLQHLQGLKNSNSFTRELTFNTSSSLTKAKLIFNSFLFGALCKEKVFSFHLTRIQGYFKCPCKVNVWSIYEGYFPMN